MDMKGIFEKHLGSEYLKFERVKNKYSNRGDLHAFILLDRVVPSLQGRYIISSADHDKIYLSISVGDFEQVDTTYCLEEVIIDLIRCGVMYNSNEEALYMLV